MAKIPHPMKGKKAPKKPAGLTRLALKYWRDCVDLIEGHGIVANPPILAMYAEQYAIYRDAQSKLEELGTTVNAKPSPFLQIINQAEAKLSQLLKDHTIPQTSDNPAPTLDTAFKGHIRAWIDEYMKDGDSTKAAERAGYSAKHSYRAGLENLKRADVRAEIARRRKELKGRNDLREDEIVQGLLAEAHGLGVDTTTAGRISALDKLGKIVGIYELDNKQRGDAVQSQLSDLDIGTLESLEAQLKRHIQGNKGGKSGAEKAVKH